MLEIFESLTCVNQTSVYSELKLVPWRFGLDRFHCATKKMLKVMFNFNCMTVDSGDDNYDVLNEIKKIHSFLSVWF
jgi:hypothetical protein